MEVHVFVPVGPQRDRTDEVVSHAFSQGFHPEHSQRLAAYWAEALGGPTTYSDCCGDEASVVRMHSGHGRREEMDRRAIACFGQALADIGLASDGRLRQVLYDYFALATTTTMSRYHRSADDVPDGLRIPQRSWDGSVSGTGPENTLPLPVTERILVVTMGVRSCPVKDPAWNINSRFQAQRGMIWR